MSPSSPFLCGSCVRALRQNCAANGSRAVPRLARQLSQSSRQSFPAAATPQEAESTSSDNSTSKPADASSAPDPLDAEPEPEKGPMARRLEEATEEALFTGGRAGRRAIEDAGFSEELKQKLLNKIADAKFENENAAALAEAGLSGRISSAAGQGTRSIAAAQPWTGQETTEDAVLRMLTDAHKPLAPGLRAKSKNVAPPVVDMRIRRDPVVSAGRKAANARDKAQAYAGTVGEAAKDIGLTPEEREALRKEFRERFNPGARAMPNTITGLAALANERIEDAIARGQFKNIPRGTSVKRDTRADNPFIDTTEYIMNKMIKRQEIVPPWIEKQQELIKTANNFRSRLRNDWKRHAARVIASHGGTLEDQMARARGYARAEEVFNPRRRNVDQISVPTNTTDDAVMVRIRRQVASEIETAAEDVGVKGAVETDTETGKESATVAAVYYASKPFRDLQWEAAERSYMELAIANLNAITRSYNLMAPELAKKPYFSLERELNSCFADVAPQLAEIIRERATRPAKSSLDSGAFGSSGVLERFVGEGGGKVKVYESRAPKYGLKEWWRDLWSPPKDS